MTTLIVTDRLNKQMSGEPGAVEKIVKAHSARATAKMEATSVAHPVRIADKAALGSAAEMPRRTEPR